MTNGPGALFPCGEAVMSDDGWACPLHLPGRYAAPGTCPVCGAELIPVPPTYRYVLNRRWHDGPIMAWVGLNPSKADADTDDNSVRRMCGFAIREGCGGICVLNAHALRATDPRELRTHPDPVGPDNDWHLTGLAEGGRDGPVVAAWGAHPFAAARCAVVYDLLVTAGVELWCFGVTESKAPRHPLYLRADAPLMRYDR